MNEYGIYKEPKNIEIGTCKCEVCGAVGKLILRQGQQFKRWFCECPNGHIPDVKKEIDDIFQIGDRIRVYHTPFSKNREIDLTTYEEGFIIAKYKDITCYSLDMKIDKAVHQNKDIIKTSWIYGHVVKGINSDSYSIELLTPQLKFEVTE